MHFISFLKVDAKIDRHKNNDYVFWRKKDVKLNLAPKIQWAEASTSNASVYDIMKCPKIEREQK